MQVHAKQAQRLLALSKLAVIAAAPESLEAFSTQKSAALRIRDQRLALLAVQVAESLQTLRHCALKHLSGQCIFAHMEYDHQY